MQDVEEHNVTTYAGQETKTEPGKPKPHASPIAGVPYSPPSVTNHHITYQPEKGWWDKIRPFIEIGGAALLAVYAFFAIRMYGVNKQAADAAASAAYTAAETLTKGALINNISTSKCFELS